MLYVQWVREFANKLMARLQRGEVIQYQLYLRPFAFDDTVNLPNPQHGKYQLSPKKGLEEDPRVGFEMLVVEALKSRAPTVVLDAKPKSSGLGQVSTDDQQWTTAFELLATHANAVIIVPANTSGVRLEIAWLKEAGLWPKCIFVMPPRADQKKIFGRGVAIDPLRKQTAAELTGAGIAIPDFDAGGMLFRLNAEGRYVDVRPFSQKSLARAVDPLPFTI